MATMYMGQIIMFGGNYAIQDFGFCQGQLVQISQYQALYSILGTSFGGDGVTTLGIPDLRGRAPVGYGTTQWGQHVPLGAQFGTSQMVLGEQHLPTHTHGVSYQDSGGSGSGGLTVQTTAGDKDTPDSDSYLAGHVETSRDSLEMYTNSTGNEESIKGVTSGFDVNKLSVSSAGGGNAFDPSGPRLAVSFLMCMNGTYPPRN